MSSLEVVVKKPNRMSALIRASFLQKLDGYVNTQLIYIMAKSGMADLLSDGAKSSEILAKELGVAHDILHRILRACVSSGLLVETQADHFVTTPLSQLLESERSDSLRDYAILTGDVWYPAWGSLFPVVENKSEQTPFERVFGCDYYHYFTKNPDASLRFNQFMQARTVQSAQALTEAYDFSNVDTVVDIGGGNGTLLQNLLHVNPRLKGILYDRDDVVAEAKEIPALYHLATRCEFVGGDFMQQIPGSGDVYILSQILHNWNDEQCEKILGNCFQAMQSNAKLLVLEQIIPEALCGNMPAVEMDLMMLVLTQGQERTLSAYKKLLDNSNFRIVNTLNLKRLGYVALEIQKIE